MRIDKPACAVFAAALLLMFPRSVFAQEIGVKAGVNVAWMAPQEDETPDITPKPGVVAGVWLRTKVTDRVSFQAEGLLSEKGVKFRFGEFARLDARLRYLEIPLLARADFGAPTSTTRVFVVGGAAPAFELINRATAQFEGREVTRDIVRTSSHSISGSSAASGWHSGARWSRPATRTPCSAPTRTTTSRRTECRTASLA
jgi:hypothetical protein